ncbi:MAG TPA: histidine kinase [Anaerolineales bacterium]|nr:GAF domain-containing protein [Anaerolineales bacterium]HMS00395.1 histidine kinase [Anaerolineales bacterium]HNQ96383.1 histidine kinase [Anaerolineales bacterium]HNS61693.1 histidine kinase [Anaerolineales bacterium]
MRKFETPYVADWLAVSLRWVTLVGLLVSLGLRDLINAVSLTIVLLMALWNIGMSVLAGMNLRIRFHRYIVLAVDFVLAALFFYLQGGLGNASVWTGLYPILTGAVYFELMGSLVAGLLFIAWQLFVSRASLMNGFTFSISNGLTLTVLFTLVCGVGGRMLMRRLRFQRRTRLDAEERRSNMESERLRAIYELTSTLTATLSYKRVLDSALDLGYSALNPTADPDEPELDERLVSAVYLFRGNELRVGSARRYTNADMRVNLHGNEGILKKIFDDGEPLLSTDVGYDPELGRIIALRSCTAAYCFPLRSGFNVYGMMLFAHPDQNYFTPERRGLLDIIGRQAVIAVQNARLYQDLVEEKERMVEVQEETRKKLARDLHDGPTQSVAAMAMRINIARRMITKNVDEATDELKKIEELAHRTTKEIRHMLFTLRPLILESQGLTAALEAMAEKMRETFQQNVVINVDEKILENMEMGKQGVIFYIIEEATNNARKHANAVHIWVRLRPFETGIALLEIEDDGLGFDVDAVNKSYDKRGSLGMVNLRERTELVSGLLNIDSALGKGTRIQVYIPLTEEATDRLHHAKR